MTVSQIAMAYIFRQKLNTFAIVSTSNASRMEKNVEALSLELTEQECTWLDLRDM